MGWRQSSLLALGIQPLIRQQATGTVSNNWVSLEYREYTVFTNNSKLDQFGLF